MENGKRSSFTGKLGFVLAAAGSAVGLGNIWRFPYLAAEYGGGMFLLTYIVLAVTFGFALMVAEIAIGRKTGLSAIGAFGALSKKHSFIGYLAAIVPIIILPYYSVIGGWVLKYLAMFISGNGIATADGEGAFFTEFTGLIGEPILWFGIFIGVTMLIVLFGVEKGIENASKVMMPILVVLTIIIAIYSMVIDIAEDGGAGIAYYFVPDFSKFSPMTVVAALGQLFYSMSLAMGIMITYGSYMKKDVNIENSVHQIEIFDTGIAFLAGLMIIPAVVSAGTESVGKGPGLMFIALPKVFESMPAGEFIGAIFFILVLFAALTSAISLAETIISIICDKLHLKRLYAIIVVFIGCILLGLPSTLGFGILSDVKPLNMDFLTFFDFLSNSVIMPIVALLTCLFITFVIKTKTVEDEVESSGKFSGKMLFRVIIKYVAPIFLVIILISSVINGLIDAGYVTGGVAEFFKI